MRIATEAEIVNMCNLLKWKGHKIFTKQYELNIIGLRTDRVVPNTFDDQFLIFWKDNKQKWQGKYYKCTTDPGTFWLNNPMNPKGTAILKSGQYVNCYAIGKHQGLYEALVQVGKVTVMRKYKRDALIDFGNGTEDTGLFGINIHRANSVGTTKTVDKNSAGCQVFENATEFAEFMAMCQKHKSIHGNKFTYTLSDQRSFNRMLKRRSIYTFGLVLVALGIVWYNRKYLPKVL